MDIKIRSEEVVISDDVRKLSIFSSDENSLVVQIATKENDDRGHPEKYMTFYIPESVRSVLEAVFVRGLK